MESEFIFTAMSGSNASNVSLPTTGCFMGNGKLAIVNSATSNEISVDRVVISKNIDYKNGMYQPNVLDIFIPFGIEIISLSNATQSLDVHMTSTELNMNTGISKNVFDMQDESGNFKLSLSNSLYCVRHMPYSSVQTIESSNVSSSELRFVHNCWTKDNLIDVTYENSVKFTGNDVPTYMFIGNGKTNDGCKVAFSSCYLFESSNIVIKPMGLGTKIQNEKKNYQFNCFDISNITDSNFKVHIVSTFITSHDFDDPRSEAIRISTNICSPNPIARTPGAIVRENIRSPHVNAWSSLWSTKISITNAATASPEQVTEVYQVNKCLYAALYYIYSNIRENFNVNSNPNAIPILDYDGSLIYEADLWLIPLLLLIKPDIARTLIEFRFVSLQQSIQLASSYGFKGAKIPFIDDIIGYKNNLYYNTSAYIHLFNSCMVVINAWNFYRVSQDKDWLRSTGFSIIKNVSAYVLDVVTIDHETDTIQLKNVVGLDTHYSAVDNSFTNNLVRLVAKYITEASYEMLYPVDDAWMNIYNGLALHQFPGPLDNYKIYKVDADSVLDAGTVNIPEVLHMFLPGIWENFDRTNMLKLSDIIAANCSYYTNTTTGRLSSLNNNQNRPINLALKTITTGVTMNSIPGKITDFMAFLTEFMTNNIVGPWRQMKGDSRFLNINDNGYTSIGNSITTNSMFLLMFLQGIFQMRIIGGISSSRFYYEDMKIAYLAHATMPSYWNIVSVTNVGIGPNKITLDISPSGSLSGSSVGTPVNGVYLMNGDFSIFTP